MGALEESGHGRGDCGVCVSDLHACWIGSVMV